MTDMSSIRANVKYLSVTQLTSDSTRGAFIFTNLKKGFYYSTVMENV